MLELKFEIKLYTKNYNKFERKQQIPVVPNGKSPLFHQQKHWNTYLSPKDLELKTFDPKKKQQIMAKALHLA